jgi:hypothetical protein
MSDYQLTATDTVIRIADSAWIPNDPANRDRIEYEQWLVDGGVPDPYIPPDPIQPTADPQSTVLFDHENRLLALEGQPPLTLVDFLKKM